MFLPDSKFPCPLIELRNGNAINHYLIYIRGCLKSNFYCHTEPVEV